MKLRALFVLGFAAATQLLSSQALADEATSTAPSGEAVALASVMPHSAKDIAVVDTDKATVQSGVFNTGQVILSVPFTYSHIFRVTRDVVGDRWSIKRILFKKDTMGFQGLPVMPPWDNTVAHDVYCVFYMDALGYERPVCFLTTQRSAETINMFMTATYNNLPSTYVKNDIMGANIQVSDLSAIFDDQNQTIDHPFHLDLMIKGWDKDSIKYQWRSERDDVDEPGKLSLGADGVARLALVNGILALKPGEDGHINVDFIAAPVQGQ